MTGLTGLRELIDQSELDAFSPLSSRFLAEG